MPASFLCQKGQIGGIDCISLSLGSRYLACAGDDGIVRVWDLKLKKTVRTIKDHASFADLHSGGEASQRKLKSVCFSLDDSCVASGGESGIVMVHNLRSNKRVALLRPPAAGSHTYGLRSIHCSPHTAHELAACYENGHVIVWDTKAQREKATFSNAHRATATSVCYSPTQPSRLVSVGLDKRIVFYDASNGGKKVKMMLAKEPLTAVSFSPCGMYVAAGSVAGSVYIYCTDSHSPVRVLDELHAPGPVNDVKFYMGSARSLNEPKSKVTSLNVGKTGATDAREKEQYASLANKRDSHATDTDTRPDTQNAQGQRRHQNPTKERSDDIVPVATTKEIVTSAGEINRASALTQRENADEERTTVSPPSQLAVPDAAADDVDGATSLANKTPSRKVKPSSNLPAMPSPIPVLSGVSSENMPSRASLSAVTSRESLREMFDDMKAELKEDVQSMHLELLRQFQVQLSDISELLDTYTTKFGDVVRENARLRRTTNG